MKKWRNTILLSVISAALAITAHWWVPKLLPLQGIVFKNGKTVGTFKDFVQVIAGLVALVSPFFKIASDKRQTQEAKHANPAPSVTNSKAGHDINVASGNIQTGGVSAQGPIHGDAVAGDQKTVHDGDLVEGNKYVITQLSQPVLSSPHQLPPPPADFTGRVAELTELRAAIEKGGVHISGLQGQGGVGKTALALKLAAELAPHYPDAQIFLDLKGVSEKPLTAADAMSHVLRAFHPEAKLPEREEELLPQYLSVMHNRRVLLLMDNAKGAAQVRSLIPPSGCTLLVTSRTHFRLPGLYQKDLNIFPPDDAARFLLEIAPRLKPEAETIARLCGYLALALRLAATAIAEHKDIDPANYRQRLADEKQRLKVLGGKEEEGVEASFTLSYKLLDDQTKVPWQMLSVFPDRFDAPAAAAIWEAEIDAAKETLSRLVQYSMLEWNEATKRYRLHDLMRAFARQELSPLKYEDLLRRHAMHYGAVLKTADDFYSRGGDSITKGLTIFDLERPNIQAGHSWASTRWPEDREAATVCCNYPAWGTYVLSLRQHPREQIRWRETALDAARQLEDRAAEGRHLNSMGIAYDSLGRYAQAIECFTLALAIALELHDRRSEGGARGNLGLAYGALDYPHLAINYHQHHLTLARAIGDRRGEGIPLGNLAAAYESLGQYKLALEGYKQRLEIARETGDRRGEGIALGSLGRLYESMGDNSQAAKLHTQRADIFREIGDRRSEGMALGDLGIAYKNLGETNRAIECYERHLAIAREIGDMQGECTALWNLSLALHKLGKSNEAIVRAEASLSIHREIEDPFTENIQKQINEWQNPRALRTIVRQWMKTYRRLLLGLPTHST